MIQRSLGLWVGVVALVGCGHGIRHEVVSAGTTAAAPITMPLSTGTYDLKLHIMSPRAQVVQYEWVCQPAGGVAFTRSGSVGQPFAEFRTARLAQLNRERKAQADRLTQQAQYALSQPQPASGQPQPAVVASGQPQPTVVASGQITANVNTPIGSVNAGILLNDRDTAPPPPPPPTVTTPARSTPRIPAASRSTASTATSTTTPSATCSAPARPRPTRSRPTTSASASTTSPTCSAPRRCRPSSTSGPPTA